MDLILEPTLDRDLRMATQLGLDPETYRALKALESRDIRPEDYDLLGRLDETIKPATLDGKRLQIFPTETFREGSRIGCPQDATCGVCMEDFQDGEEIRTLLPCEHKFHKDCIDYWLLERATTCPVDNLDVRDGLSTSSGSWG